MVTLINKIGETDLHLNPPKRKAETGFAGNSIKTSAKAETVTTNTDVNIVMLGVMVSITDYTRLAAKSNSNNNNSNTNSSNAAQNIHNGSSDSK